jgi:hypothetical protein
MLGGIGAGIGGAIGNIAILAGAAGKGGLDEMKKAVNAVRGLPEDLELDLRSVTPAELRMVAQLRPEVYNAVVPQEAALAEDSMPGRDSQLYVMEELRRRASQGEPVGERLANQSSQNAMAQELGRNQENLINSLEQRGRLGMGAYTQARAGFGQEAANLARDQGSDLVRQNISNRLGALVQLGNVGGQERAQTIGLNEGRSNAINRLNEYVSTMLTNQNRYAADSRNQANMYNVDTRQRLSDTNALNRQGLQERNIDRQNQARLAQGGYGLDRSALLAQQLRALGDARYDEQAARAQSIRGVGQGVGQAAGGLLGGI